MHKHACTFQRKLVHAHAHTHTQTHTCMHVFAYTHTCMCVVFVCTHTHIHAHTHTHTRTHTHTHTHAHAHTHTRCFPLTPCSNINHDFNSRRLEMLLSLLKGARSIHIVKEPYIQAMEGYGVFASLHKLQRLHIEVCVCVLCVRLCV